LTTIKPDQVKSSVASFIEYRDLEFQTEPGIIFNNLAFTADTDRVYDVRTGASVGIAVQFDNFAGTDEDIIFAIQSSNYGSIESDLSDIPEDSWSDLEPETNLPEGSKSAIFEFFRATPAITAIRLRIKLATAGAQQVTGIIGWF